MTAQEKKQWLENWNVLIEEIKIHNSLNKGWSATRDEQLKYHKRLLLQELIDHAGGIEKLLERI